MKKPLLFLALMMGATMLANSQTPIIESFSPSSGAVGDTITITGSGFNSAVDSNIVRFGGVKAEVVSVPSATVLKVKVPTGASYAPITVTNTANAKRLTAYSPGLFVVTFSAIRTVDTASFAPRVDLSTLPGTAPRGIAVADIDGDGRPDIAVSNPASGAIGIYRNISSVGGIGSNSFAARVEYSLGSAPYGVAFGDLDGDGDLDLAVTDTSNAKVYVWQNASIPGTIDTSSISTYSVGTKPFAVAIADLDGDGKPDIATANKGSNSVSVLRNTTSNGSIAFAAATNTSVGGSTAPVFLAIADVDDNGIFDPDVITANSGNSTVAILQNECSPGSIYFSLALGKPTGTSPSGIVAADFDGDGLVDVASASSGGTKVSVLRNSTISGGAITFDTKVDFEAGSNLRGIIAANIEGDGKADLVVSYVAVDSIAVFRNTASSGSITTGSFATKVSFFASAGQAGLAAADFDCDGKPDILTANPSGNSFSLFRNKAVRLEQEPNDIADNANPLMIGETLQGDHPNTSDADCYRIQALAGDTLEVLVTRFGSSNAYFTLEVFDSLGGYISLNNRWQRSQFPSGWNIHNIFPVFENKTYYLRVRHPDGWGPEGIGEYRIRLERYAPSKPDLSAGTYTYRLNYNSTVLGVEASANGSLTSTMVEWGASPDNLANSAVGSNPRDDISSWNPDALITGLLPGQRYYFRLSATNSFGTVSTSINSFDTPPAPVGWEILEIGGRDEFRGVSFPSLSIGYAVGGWHRVIKTTDGGKSWSDLWLPRGWVAAVSFSSPSTGLVVGESGMIFKTTDGGATWSEKTASHNYRTLYAVRYFNASTAIAVGDGGTIVRSTDNWETWDTVRTGSTDLTDISIVGLNTAFVVGASGTILKTTDAGATWTTISSGTTNRLNGVHFFNSLTGYVVGEWMTYRKTTDGGAHWVEYVHPTDNWVYDIGFRDANNGLIVGHNGRLLRTTDGGNTWEHQYGGTYSFLKGIAFAGRTVIVVGENGVSTYIDPAAESEPNDNTAEAMPVEFRDDIEAAIQPTGDVDYYALTASAGDTVEVSTVALDSIVVNGILEFLDSGETLLVQNDDYVPGDTVQSRIVYVIPSSGTYYARYSSKSGITTGNYKIRFRETSLRPSIPYAGIASIHTSTYVTLAAPVVSNNINTNVEFEYGLTLSYGSTVQALENPISDLQLKTATADLALEAEREYHFRVKASNAAGVAYGPDVSFITSTGTTRSEIEPNNLANQGNTIFIGDTVNAFLSSTADADYYRFQAKAGDTIEVFVRAGVMPNPYSNWGDPHLLRLQIVDSTNGWNLVSNDILPHPANLHSTIIANNTGIYHIRVASRNNNLSYPSAAPDAGEPQLQPTGIASSDTASYQLRLRRFEPAAPETRFDHWGALVLHDSAVIYVEILPNGLPTTFTLEYGQSIPFDRSVTFSGTPLNGVYSVGTYIPISPLQPWTGYGSRIIAVNAAGRDTSEIWWWGTPKSPEGWSTKPVTERQGLDLRDVAFKNEQEGMVVGGNELMRTTDGGNTWVWAQNPGIWAGCIGFANDTTATAAGNGFARTTNAGVTWTYQFNLGGWTSRLGYANTIVGYAVGEGGRIAKTTDAGITWNTLRLNSQYLNDLFILAPETVYVVGEWGTILRTFNGGAIWDSIATGTTKHFYGIAFANGTIGFAVGQEGMVKRTTDGGTTWSTIVVPDGNWFRDIAFRDVSRGIIVGDGGVILRTTDGGTTWSRQESGTYNGFRAISYVGRRAVAVEGYGLVARFLDPYDEPEPNNTAAQAFAIPYGEKLNGVISPAGDIDYYKFTAAAGDTIALKSTNRTGSQLNVYLELLNNSQIVIASNDNFVPNDSTQARVVYAVSNGGTYYIRLSSVSAGGTGEYLLELQKTSLSPTIVSTASPSVAPTSATLTATVVPNNLPTGATFQWGPEGSFANSIAGIPATVNGQQVGQFTASLTGLTPFTRYNFRVLALNAAGSTLSDTSYFFTPRLVALAEIEPNNVAGSAQFMTLTDTVAATLFPSSDVDYYKFHGEAGDTIEFQAVSNATWYWRLRMLLIDSVDYVPNPDPNKINNEYFDEGWFPSEYRLWQSRVLNRTSTYYVVIFNDEGFEASDSTSYRVHIRKFGPSISEIAHNSWTHTIHNGMVVLSTFVAPRGLKTTVTFEYGPTSSLGTTVTVFGHPHYFSSEINGYSYGQVFTPPITTLQPSSRYYMRATARNSAGVVAQQISEFWTPPASDGWSLVPTSGYAAGRRISFPTQDIGYLVGNMGNVFKTTDGGATWGRTGLGLSVHDHFEGISFLNPDTGIGVGQGPRIFKTNDGGNTWSYVWQHELGFSSALYDVEILDANTAVAVSADPGGRIIRTTDAGVTWSTVAQTNRGLRALCFSPSCDTGYAVGDYGIAFRTSDRGLSWLEITTPDSAQLRDVFFFNGARGLAVGYPKTVLRTTDAGNSWTKIATPAHSWWHLGIAFADSLHGLVVGDGGDIYRSNDGGLTWTWEESGTWNNLPAVAFSGRRAVVNSDGGFALTAVGLLARPSNVVASYSSQQYVNVSWTDIAGETGYFVERKDSSNGTYRRVKTLGADATTMVDSVTQGRIYYYRMQSFNIADTSLYSTPDTVLVPLRIPYNLVAVALTKTSVRLTWENGPDARVGYIIGRKTTGSRVSIDTVGDVTTYIDYTASSGTAYTYDVQSYNAEMRSAYSNQGSVTTPGLVAAPSNLVATYQSPNLVNISWSDNANNESGYFVEKKIGGGGTYSLLRAVGQSFTFTRDTVQRGRIYFYRVRGYSAADTSSYAAEDSALAPLFTPFNFDAATLSSSSIRLTWQNSGDARTGYRVERKTGAGGTFTEIATLPFPDGSDNMAYTDNGAASGTRYHYRIRSYTSEMNSAYSNIDSALTALGRPQNLTANPSTLTNRSITISWSGPNGAAQAWYEVDSRPSAGAVGLAVTGNSFILSSPPRGARWIYVALQNSEGVKDLAAYDSVQIFYDNVTPQITDQTVLPTVTITGSSVTDPASATFQAAISKPSGIASLLNPTLEYKKTNSNSVISTPFPTLNGGTLNVGNLNSLFLTVGKPNGAEYRITASDNAGNSASTAWKSFTVFVNAPPGSDFVPPAAGSSDDITALISNYRLFSVPYELTDKKPAAFMETVDKGLGPHAKDGVSYYFWRMQRYVNSTYQDYEEFKSEDAVTPGAAFFLISREQKTITVGSGNLVKAQDMYAIGIPVLQGWNLIGNPFPDDLPSDSLFVDAGAITDKAYYDGTGPDGGWWKTGSQVQTLKKWEGLAINVSQITSLRFKAVPPQTNEEGISPAPVATSARQAILEKQKGGWLMNIDAHRSGSSIVDVGNTIGEVPGANEGYDQFDSFQPPLIPGKSLAVYFKNADGAMSNDIRPIQANGSAWEMKVVTGDRGSRVTLSVNDIVPIADATLEAYLLDVDDHMAHNLKEKRNVEFGSKEGTRNFRVVVGSKGFVDSVSASLGIDLVPQFFMLYQNYPNPFNPETVVRYTIPGQVPRYRVILKVYNIIGQEVATLVDRDQRPGYYEVTMDARGLSSGTYICRIEAIGAAGGPNYVQVRKMVLIK